VPGNDLTRSVSIPRTAALFSKSTGRVLVSVGRKHDAKFLGLCEARSIPVLRIGVTDNSGHLEIQDIARWNLGDLATTQRGTFAEGFSEFLIKLLKTRQAQRPVGFPIRLRIFNVSWGLFRPNSRKSPAPSNGIRL